MIRILWTVFGVVVGFAIGLVVVNGIDQLEKARGAKTAEVIHPQVAFLEQAVGLQPNQIDFSKLNDGYWSWLCLAGENVDPLVAMQAEAKKRSVPLMFDDATRQRFPGPLEAGFGALGVVDDLGTVSMVRFPLAKVPIPSSQPRCTDRQNPIIAYPQT